jgi:hypothetical protein
MEYKLCCQLESVNTPKMALYLSICETKIVNILIMVFPTNKIHSFCSLSYDRSVASSKASSPQGAI